MLLALLASADPATLDLTTHALLVALGAALGAVLVKLKPFAVAWLRGHGHPVAADLAQAVATVIDEHEHGADFLTAIAHELGTDEAKNLIASFRSTPPAPPAAPAPKAA